jgi:WD40 repeat protein
MCIICMYTCMLIYRLIHVYIYSIESIRPKYFYTILPFIRDSRHSLVAVRFSPDNLSFACGSADHKIYIYHRETFQLKGDLYNCVYLYIYIYICIYIYIHIYLYYVYIHKCHKINIYHRETFQLKGNDFIKIVYICIYVHIHGCM